MDKREFPRYDRDILVKYATSIDTPVADTTGRSLNISPGGIYMLSGSLLERGREITLTFTLNMDGEMTTLKTTGSVIRSGKLTEDPDMIARYNIQAPDRAFFAAVRFSEPFIELSFMLH